MSERLWNILLDSFWKIFLPGLKVTIPLTVISFSIALVIATAMAMVQFANIKGLRQIARFYIWIFRGTPLLVQLFVVFYGLPRAGILIDPFPAAVLVFSLNEGAYSAETMRAALEAVPAGQLEAGYCVGMSYLQIMRRIILPQAMRTAFPPLSSKSEAIWSRSTYSCAVRSMIGKNSARYMLSFFMLRTIFALYCFSSIKSPFSLFSSWREGGHLLPVRHPPPSCPLIGGDQRLLPFSGCFRL